MMLQQFESAFPAGTKFYLKDFCYYNSHQQNKRVIRIPHGTFENYWDYCYCRKYIVTNIWNFGIAARMEITYMN